MKFRELKSGDYFVFVSRCSDAEIRRKVSRHTYVWVYPDGAHSSPWKARGETQVVLLENYVNSQV